MKIKCSNPYLRKTTVIIFSGRFWPLCSFRIIAAGIKKSSRVNKLNILFHQQSFVGAKLKHIYSLIHCHVQPSFVNENAVSHTQWKA